MTLKIAVLAPIPRASAATAIAAKAGFVRIIRSDCRMSMSSVSINGDYGFTYLSVPENILATGTPIAIRSGRAVSVRPAFYA
jgi:hypothetical protein